MPCSTNVIKGFLFMFPLEKKNDKVIVNNLIFHVHYYWQKEKRAEEWKYTFAFQFRVFCKFNISCVFPNLKRLMAKSPSYPANIGYISSNKFQMQTIFQAPSTLFIPPTYRGRFGERQRASPYASHSYGCHPSPNSGYFAQCLAMSTDSTLLVFFILCFNLC